jgi:hypothetical protein
LCAAALALAGDPDNPLLKELAERGLPADGAGKVCAKFDAPTMPDGLDAAAQRKVIEQAAAGRDVNELLRNSIVSPFVTKISDLPLEGAAEPLRRVDVWYVAYGPLDAFFSERFLESMADLGGGGTAKKGKLPSARHVLKESELKSQGIEPRDADDLKERWWFAMGALFDRVLISSTRRTVATRHGDSVIVAAAVDPRFNGHKEYGNWWRKVEVRGEQPPDYGPVRPYVASASYSKITRLAEPAGAVFIEHHHIFAEPNDWFDGKNLLRSKLPMVVQDSVRTLRRELRNAPPPVE